MSGGCEGLMRSSTQMRNENYYTHGQWNLHGPYELPDVTICAGVGAGSPEVSSLVSEYITSAVAHAFSLSPVAVKADAQSFESSVCALTLEAYADDLKMRPSVTSAMRQWVVDRHVPGVVLPVVFVNEINTPDTLRNSRGDVVLSRNTGRYAANGSLVLFLLYINEEGEIVHLSRQPYSQYTPNYRHPSDVLREKFKKGLADELVRDLLHDRPNVDVAAARR